METLTDSAKFLVTMLSVLNPLGAVPLFITLTQSLSDDQLKKVAKTSALAVFITICVSMFSGRHLLDFFGISIASFRVGGGFLIAMTALSMLNAKTAPSKLNKQEMESVNPSEIGIVPLAIPLLAGPGAISSSVIQSSHFETFWHWVGAVVVMAILCLGVGIVLSMARRVSKRIGDTGVNVMGRIMGLILMSIAVEFIAIGIKELFDFVPGPLAS